MEVQPKESPLTPSIFVSLTGVHILKVFYAIYEIESAATQKHAFLSGCKTLQNMYSKSVFEEDFTDFFQTRLAKLLSKPFL